MEPENRFWSWSWQNQDQNVFWFWSGFCQEEVGPIISHLLGGQVCSSVTTEEVKNVSIVWVTTGPS